MTVLGELNEREGHWYMLAVCLTASKQERSRVREDMLFNINLLNKQS